MDVATLMDQNISWNDELYHHGVKGMKWGVIRKHDTTSGSHRGSQGSSTKSDETNNISKNTDQKKGLSSKQKKAIKIGAAAVGTTLAIYGTYKVSKYVKNSKKPTKEQMDYIIKNIQNTPSHIDKTRSIRNSEKYQHGLQATILSRRSSIKGDRALYGEKAVKGRDAFKEAKNFSDNVEFYKIHRNNMYGWK